MTLHVMVPGEWTVQRGHELLERLEADIRRALPDAILFTHLEALGDPASLTDVALERGETPRATPAWDKPAQPGAEPDASAARQRTS